MYYVVCFLDNKIIEIHQILRNDTISTNTIKKRHTFIALLKLESGKIQRGRRGHDVTLVLDCSGRMQGKSFTTMIEAATKYVNGMYVDSINVYLYSFNFKLLNCLLNTLVIHMLFILVQVRKRRKRTMEQILILMIKFCII